MEAPKRPCQPSPCGSNAICRERNGAGSCSCQPQYFGDPYTGCRPECVLSSDCAKDRACINNRCSDPCPGTCGINAQCRVINHVPSCSCLPGYTGDSLRSCSPIPAARKNLICLISYISEYCQFSVFCSCYVSPFLHILILYLLHFLLLKSNAKL